MSRWALNMLVESWLKKSSVSKYPPKLRCPWDRSKAVMAYPPAPFADMVSDCA